MSYAELHCLSNFSFLRGASHPEELVSAACELGYTAIAITDECSLAGVVRAHVRAKQLEEQGFDIKIIVGSEFALPDNSTLVVLAPNKSAYESLSAFISLCRRRSEKGEYQLLLRDLGLHLQHCLLIYLPALANAEHKAMQGNDKNSVTQARHQTQQLLASHQNIWVGYQRGYSSEDEQRYQLAYQTATLLNCPMVACGNVHMHSASRLPLQHTLTAIRHNTPVQQLGTQLASNAECYLRSLPKLAKLYPEPLLRETLNIADRCHFSLDELRYQYPQEVVPPGLKPYQYLRELVMQGAARRWPAAVPASIKKQIDKELALIKNLHYEYYFLTVHDIVDFARQRNILCQGRGSAANSVVCYCLFITEVDPSRVAVLFERFISKERDEPPDIDVDFEHERREEVIQYIYKKYSRERAALAATVISYRSRSAIRDVGKALGFNSELTEKLSRSLGWWHKPAELEQQLCKAGLDIDVNHPSLDTAYEHGQTHDNRASLATLFMQLVKEIMGFPRHLSQHVGGFIISDGPLSRLVPVENASMPDRTVIQWDKDDIEALGLLKVDVLGLGMLSAIRKMLAMANSYPEQNYKQQAVEKQHTNFQQPQAAKYQNTISIASIPEGDQATYNMLCAGDSVGVFQVESRAQMSMLPRLKPRCFYDLVIQVAIVRPGPIQGNMVHPFLRRREQKEAVSFENEAVREVLARTLGVPIFQEQVIKLAMVAAGFSGGEADQLRRAMASWGKNGNLLQFRERLLEGMLARNYSPDFAERLFEQMKGFGSYGFPESHAASFALLVYVSSWLKCHYPAAFYTALINSQPMGFYSPSQLVQDARRHNINVLPIDVQYSNWDCSLEFGEHENNTAKQKSASNKQPAIRLGLRSVKGLAEEAGQGIANARCKRAFSNLADMVERAGLDQHNRRALLRANACASLTGHRHQAHWQNLAIEATRVMQNTGSESYTKEAADNGAAATLDSINARRALDDGIVLSAPSEMQDIRADYVYTGLTLRRHPMQVLRSQQPFNRCTRCVDLAQLPHKRYAMVAGIVTGRQRPGTASGVIFLTLEDETGNINVVVWKQRQEQFREVLLKSKLLLVKGVLEKKGTVIHVIAGQLQDHSDKLQGYLLPSRDFH
ncbi:MAG: error-prone DNA polymerase [Pseudomonadales bacterium]|nr:error-prone DNA polymerase [Pseudomonadales bacterium]